MTVTNAASVEPGLRPLSTETAPVLVAAPGGFLDEESRAWLRDLRAQGTAHDAAVQRCMCCSSALHASR